MAEPRQSDNPISSAAIFESASAASVLKSTLPFPRMFILSILAGMYIGFGGILFLVTGVGIQDTVPYGIGKLLQGLSFCLGLILVVVGGAELFTGNTLMVIPLLEKKISMLSLLRNWGVVYTGNFIGSFLLAVLVFFSRMQTIASGQFGELIIAVANKKVGYGFLQAFVLGILCNILVCLAVWMAYSAKNTTGKILAILFPITAFIAAGFEHSVANMFLVPIGLLIKWFDASAYPSIITTNLTLLNFLVKNLIPVTLGNIVGGSGFVGLAYFLAYRTKSRT